MNGEKEQIELLDKERLLTENEKKYIVDVIKNRNSKGVILFYGIVLFFLIIICALLISANELCVAILFFIVVNIILPIVLYNTWNTASKLAESIKQNEVYAREAIYVAAGMNRYANFKVKKDGRVQSYLTNAFLLEKFNCGDKVILIQMEENYVWVYKAREDKASPD